MAKSKSGRLHSIAGLSGVGPSARRECTVASLRMISVCSPAIQTELDPKNTPLKSLVNGEVRQDSSTGVIKYTMNEIVSYISTRMTLCPQDVILTGTPPASDNVIRPGDEIRLSLEGIGTLVNRVVRG